jgi:hypothetical protein
MSTPTRTENNVFQETVNRDLDILFMVDDSLSMKPLINKLTTNFPVFIQVLQGLPGGLPNVHIAVVSSDMGAGTWTGIPQCNPGGDGGKFQYMVGAGTASSGMPCTSTGLDANQHFISSVNGTTNFGTNPIQDVFSCIANLGDGGCGFEHQLQSVVRALNADGQGVVPGNENFLRPNAYLAIILLTNEDDCSAPSNTPLFDTNSKFVSDQYGPLQSYRCNEYGHLCRGNPPPRTMAAQFNMGDCVPAEEKGLLIPVSNIVKEIQSLKTDPNQILVAAIAGPPDPYNVIMVPPTLTQDPSQWPNVDHSCVQNSGEYADPAVRIASFVEAFGGNGLFLPICANSFAPALQTIASTIGKVLGPRCITGNVVQKANGQPDCSVIDKSFDDAGNPVNTPVPACADNNNTAPCWQLTQDAMNCPNAQVLSVMRPTGMMPPSGLSSAISCSVCIPGAMQTGCP